ncbi:MAG: ComEC/Rec2 family competence protein [Alphaproteobacteria bacterium]
MISVFNHILDSFFHTQKDHLILWSPVFIGLGIIVYFSGCDDWTISWFLIGALLLVGFSGLIFFHSFFKLRWVCAALFCGILGFTFSHVRTFFMNTPVLKTTIPDPVWVRGVVEDISEGVNQKKIILSPHRIEKVTRNLPKKVQLIYRFKKEKERLLQTGDHVILKAKLEPLQGPIVPGGYDFQKQARFKEIGAQGYVVYIHRITRPEKTSFFRKIGQYRLSLTQSFLKHLPGERGAVGAALVTGDTGSLSKETRTAFADSGTAHVLAISGLHLSLIGGLLLGFSRLLVGLCPPLILRIPAKKIAAILAVLGAMAYLYISGCRIPTQRAFISFSLMMVAILIDRNPLSMRLVAIAATSILLLSPEALFTPSFQLSFAAVTALIAFYESIQIHAPKKSVLKKIAFYGLGILISSLIASVATLPFTLYHFYKFTLQSLGSNLLMIPVLSLWVMPLALCFVFFGWWTGAQEICALLMGQGIDFMIQIAHTFSQLAGSLIYVPGFSLFSFGVITLGGLLLCLLKGTIRWSGIIWVLGGILYTVLYPKPIPDVFIAEGGKNIGIVYQNHLFISSPRTDSFLATVWASYAGISPDHVIKLKQKKLHPCIPPVTFYGKNILINLNDLTIGYLRTEDNQEMLQNNINILIAPKLSDTHHTYGSYPKFFLGSKNLNQKSWVYYKKSKQLKAVMPN